MKPTKEQMKIEQMETNKKTIPTEAENKTLTPAEREILKLKFISYSKKNENFKNYLQSKISAKAGESKNNQVLIEFGNNNREEAKKIESLSESEFKDLENMIEKEEIKISDMPYALMRAFFKYKHEKKNHL